MSSMDRPADLADIDYAYRMILGREPDRAGFATYHAHVESGMTFGQLRDDFLYSEEFRTRTGFAIEQSVQMGEIFISVDANEPEFGRHIAEHGHWEEHLLAIIARELRPGDTFVDIGANVGVMSFNAAAAVGPSGLVLAFEPLPDNLYHFTKGVAANNFTNVRLFPFALSDERATFAILGSSNGYLMPAAEGARLALALRGDDILADQPRVDFIKLDIEGHEPFALAGLAATIARHRPRILCEFNPRCLVEHIGRAPHDFAEQLFGLTSTVDAIEHDGARTKVDNAADLMALWQKVNREAVATGRLVEGMAMLDLLFTADRA